MAAHSSSIHGFQPARHADDHHGHGSAHPASPRPQHRSSRHPPQRHESRHAWWLWLAVSAAMIVGGLLIWAVTLGADKEMTVADLIDQMVVAADGSVGPTHHALGGRLYAKRDGDQVVVVANGLPQKECVQVGWTLMRRGIITINGVTPQRISAAILADLCAKGDDDLSKLEWAPKSPD